VLTLASTDGLATLEAQLVAVAARIGAAKARVSAAEQEIPGTEQTLASARRRRQERAVELGRCGDRAAIEHDLAAVSRELIQRAWRQIDSDGNGVLDRLEFQSVMVLLNRQESQAGTWLAEVDAVFDEVDENLDGDLDFSEFERWFMREHSARVAELGHTAYEERMQSQKEALAAQLVRRPLRPFLAID
jgi:hypothetical protein